MNEIQFGLLWESEKATYAAWGAFVFDEVANSLRQQGFNPDYFLKVPAIPRLKNDKSLIDKAFYREKNYKDPYNEIEDKVGVRFVVLLLEHIDIVCSIIQSNSNWHYDPCKNFQDDREKEPLLFTYQSMHFILRPNTDFIYNGQKIPCETPCEVQIRTLLQHAHAELTHDSIYKSKNKIKAKTHRIVAKSMALIETTDDFFDQATKQINYGPLEEHNILERLDRIYFNRIKIQATRQKSAILVFHEFEQFIDANLVDNIESLINKDTHIPDLISAKSKNIGIFEQSVIFFIYWMLKKHKNRLVSDWPLEQTVLVNIAREFGVALSSD